MTKKELLKLHSESPIMAEFENGKFAFLIGETFLTARNGGLSLSWYCELDDDNGNYKFTGIKGKGKGGSNKDNIVKLHQLKEDKKNSLHACYNWWVGKEVGDSFYSKMNHFNTVWDNAPHEFTLEEIADKLGVPVESLKIKK